MINNKINTAITFSIILFVILFSAKVSAISAITYNLNISDPSNHSILETNQVTISSVLLVINTDVDSSCKYSTTKGLDYSIMDSTFELEYGTIHKKTINNLIDGQYKAYVKCKNLSNTVSQELEIIYSVSLPITAQISLENGENLKDGKTGVTLITSKVPKTTPTLSYTTDSITYKQIPLVGSQNVWSGYIIIPTDRENEVGSFKFQARDLEDNIGTEITAGAIFTIDTIAPNVLLDVKAEGISKGINLTWKIDEEKLSFNIYRSKTAGVSYSDFYKKVNKENYVDTDVSAKTPYYYRISGVDAAGNEGSLSNEIYAISTLSSSSSTTALDPRYVSLVESFLDKIDATSTTLNSLASTFDLQDSEEKEMFDYLKLTNSITSAKTGIAALRSEVNSYTSQSLSKADIDKKLNSAEVRLNIIKSSIPQRLSITNKISLSNTLNENEINTHILEIKPSLDYDQLSKMSKDSMSYNENKDLSVSGQAYNIEVTYLDETQKSFTLIKKEIQFNSKEQAGASLVEVIPKDIAESTKDLTVYNKDYTVLKEDPIISFESNTNQIIYFVKERLDLNSLSKTSTFVLNDYLESSNSALGINGYFTLSQFSDVIPSSNITFAVILIVGLGIYLVFVKSKKRNIKLNKINENLDEISNALHENKVEHAMQKYSEVSKIYKDLSDKDKKKKYEELAKVHEKIVQAKKSNVGNNIKQYGLIFVFFAAMVLLLTNLTLAFDNINLLEGKNNITLNQNIDVRSLVALNPDIESITYQDEFSNTNYAYINVFGGIGKKFTLEAGKEYEIISKNKNTLITYNK